MIDEWICKESEENLEIKEEHSRERLITIANKSSAQPAVVGECGFVSVDKELASVSET